MADARQQPGMKLGLGGHSYIAQLGNDPAPSFEQQCALVAACLDAGISLFDTTYYQERVALGRVLTHLERRQEATLSAWNFFRQPGKEQDLVSWTPYAPHHIDQMLEELQTDTLDLLVIHAEDDPQVLRQGVALATRWMNAGKVRQIGLGIGRPELLDAFDHEQPFSCVLAPYNAFNQSALPVFTRARELGVKTIAMSPFIRGWKLDEIGEDTAQVADILLRWAVFQPLVDQVIVSMRKPEWVQANLDAVARGPLSDAESDQVANWVARVG